MGPGPCRDPGSCSFPAQVGAASASTCCTCSSSATGASRGRTSGSTPPRPSRNWPRRREPNPPTDSPNRCADPPSLGRFSRDHTDRTACHSSVDLASHPARSTADTCRPYMLRPGCWRPGWRTPGRGEPAGTPPPAAAAAPERMGLRATNTGSSGGVTGRRLRWRAAATARCRTASRLRVGMPRPWRMKALGSADGLA